MVLDWARIAQLDIHGSGGARQATRDPLDAKMRDPYIHAEMETGVLGTIVNMEIIDKECIYEIKKIIYII